MKAITDAGNFQMRTEMETALQPEGMFPDIAALWSFLNMSDEFPDFPRGNFLELPKNIFHLSKKMYIKRTRIFGSVMG
jgi:hypothetical protein